MGANFADANLEGANFEGASLEGTNFTGASLRCANFKGANLLAAVMIDADIEGANFQGVNLEDTNFESTDLYKAYFDETYLIDLIIKSTNLSEGGHKDANFSDSIQDERNLPEIGLDNHNFDKIKLNRRPSIKSLKEDLFVDSNTVDPGMIEQAFNDMIEKIRSNIHLDQLKAICKHQHDIEKIDKIEYEQGDIVAYNGQVACRLDFKISTSYNLSLLLDRKGKLTELSDRLNHPGFDGDSIV
jgi:hypothetical protein